MDTYDKRKARLAAILGAAVLAIPGGALVSNALAADGASADAPASTPIQQEDQGPDRDCPEKDGSGGQGSGESTAPAPSTGYDAQATAL